MKLIIQTLVILALSQIPAHATSAKSKLQATTSRSKLKISGNAYIKAVRLLARLEEKGGWVKRGKYALNLILPDAVASGQCMIAGYVGVDKGGVCKFPNGVSFNKKEISCNPDVFGPLTIPRPNDSRWTYACANAMLAGAGIQKTIDQNLSEEEHKTMMGYLEGQGVTNESLAASLSQLCAAAEESGKGQDVNDCREVTGLLGLSPKTTSEETSSKTEVEDDTVNESYYEDKKESLAQSAKNTKDHELVGSERDAAIADALKCAPSANAPQEVKTIADDLVKGLYRFDPNKHQACQDPTRPLEKSPRAYGMFTDLFTVEKYNQAFPPSKDGLVCYQQAFMDQAAKDISAALRAMPANDGGSQGKVKIGECEIDLTYFGTDVSKYAHTHSSDLNVISHLSAKITRTKTASRGEYVSVRYTPFDGTEKYSASGFTDDSRKITKKELFQSAQKDFSSYVSTFKTDSDSWMDRNGKDFVQSLLLLTYDHCSEKR